jgi:hypothetical protein
MALASVPPLGRNHHLAPGRRGSGRRQLTGEVRRRYVEAGADVIRMNTWRIDRTPVAEVIGLVSGSGGWQPRERADGGRSAPVRVAPSQRAADTASLLPRDDDDQPFLRGDSRSPR